MITGLSRLIASPSRNCGIGEGGAERGPIPGAAAPFKRVADDDGGRRSRSDNENERERDVRGEARIDRDHFFAAAVALSPW